MSTLHSAKGYDAPLVILVGCDRIKSDTEGRAQFYVGATRAKHHLVLTGIAPTASDSDRLMPEIVATAAALGILPKQPKRPETPTAPAAPQCRHCSSTNLHGQHGPYGYYLRCIAIDQDTPMPRKCPKCSQPGKIRKSGPNFHFRCPTCGDSLIHMNGDLNDMPASPEPFPRSK
ncbi:MAG: ATP-binding domain-containing protein [Planctomycetota bacterium]